MSRSLKRTRLLFTGWPRWVESSGYPLPWWFPHFSMHTYRIPHCQPCLIFLEGVCVCIYIYTHYKWLINSISISTIITRYHYLSMVSWPISIHHSYTTIICWWLVNPSYTNAISVKIMTVTLWSFVTVRHWTWAIGLVDLPMKDGDFKHSKLSTFTRG